MKCSDFRKHIAEYVDRDLDNDLYIKMDKHAGECEACACELKRENDAISALMSVQSSYTPPYVLRNVLDVVQQRKSEQRTRKIQFRMALGLVTILFVIVSVFWLPINDSKPEKVIPAIATKPSVQSSPTPVVDSVENVPAKMVKTISKPPVKHNISKKKTRPLSEVQAVAKESNTKPITKPQSQYLVVMTTSIDPNHIGYPEYILATENQVDSYYSIQVDDRDSNTLTNLNVVNEVTPDLQPSNTVEFSITNTQQPADETDPERSFNHEDNRSINCLDDTDDIG